MSRISASVARVWRRFTFSLWLYVNNYCPHTSLNLCSIIQHITWDDRYATPQIFFTRTGQPSAHDVKLSPRATSLNDERKITEKMKTVEQNESGFRFLIIL